MSTPKLPIEKNPTNPIIFLSSSFRGHFIRDIKYNVWILLIQLVEARTTVDLTLMIDAMTDEPRISGGFIIKKNSLKRNGPIV